jgi:hypothetical protein
MLLLTNNVGNHIVMYCECCLMWRSYVQYVTLLCSVEISLVGGVQTTVVSLILTLVL